MNTDGVETLATYRTFGGTQSFYRHASAAIGLPMKFGVFRPDVCEAGAPALFFLAGLTCNEETFAIKAGAQRHAAKNGLVLVTPDTSPRDTSIDGATDEWDFGEGAGFYLDATAAPWNARFCMERYVTRELVDCVCAHFDVARDRLSVFGHSMGGHGALTLALRHPGLFRSVSALAPIAAPSRCPWGEKAFLRYLGNEQSAWIEHDASALMAKATCPFPEGILVDQGLADAFLERELFPEVFEAACKAANQPLTLRRHAGYDHGYYFIATFVGDHIAFHADRLRTHAPGPSSTPLRTSERP